MSSKKKVMPRGPYSRKHTCMCMWCGERFETVRQDADTCSAKCRGRVFRYRAWTGMDPLTPPGNMTVKTAVDDLLGELLARERRRRNEERYIDSLPAWKRPPGS